MGSAYSADYVFHGTGDVAAGNGRYVALNNVWRAKLAERRG